MGGCLIGHVMLKPNNASLALEFVAKNLEEVQARLLYTWFVIYIYMEAGHSF